MGRRISRNTIEALLIIISITIATLVGFYAGVMCEKYHEKCKTFIEEASNKIQKYKPLPKECKRSVHGGVIIPPKNEEPVYKVVWIDTTTIRSSNGSATAREKVRVDFK